MVRPRVHAERRFARKHFPRRVIFLSFLIAASLNLAGCVAFSGASSLLGSSANAAANSSPSSAAPAAVPVTPPTLLILPGAVAFGNVVAGANNTQTLYLTNGGTETLIVSQVSATGNGFGVSGFSQPITLEGGQSTTVTVGFDFTSAGTSNGAVTLTSNAATSPAIIGLSATVIAPAIQLSVNPMSLSFGSTAVGVTSTQNVTLTNTGNANVSISSVSATGPGFSAGGVSNVTLAPSQAVSAAVNFDPASAGPASGSLVVISNAAQAVVGLSGTGTSTAPSQQHSVTLNWSPSVSSVVGYFVYRGTGANAQLSKLSTSVDAATNYVDTNVAAGQTYTYAVSAYGTDGVESAQSTSVSVTIPGTP
jgi:hypothetical protein